MSLTFFSLSVSLAIGFPMSRSALNAQLAVLCSHSLEEYDTQLADCVLEEEKLKKRAELVSSQASAKDACVAENHEALLRFMKKVVLDSLAATKLAFETFCAQVVPIEEVRVLEAEFATRKAGHAKTVMEALSPFPELPGLAEFKYAQLEAEEALTEFVAFKLVQNDAMVKAHKISKLQEEAIVQQQLLIEQNRRLEDFLKSEKETTQIMEAELMRLRMDKEHATAQAAEEKKRMAELAMELERVRAEKKKKKDCVILVSQLAQPTSQPRRKSRRIRGAGARPLAVIVR